MNLTKAHRLVLSVALMLGVGLALPAVAAADCGTDAGFHYAEQWTSHVEESIECGSLDYYYGWNGVDGYLSTPATYVPVNDPSKDHTIGLMGVLFTRVPPAPVGSRFNMGWYTGAINEGTGSCTPGSCIDRIQTYGWFVENRSPAIGNSVTDFGTATVGTGSTDRVVYSSGCWDTYLGYPGTLLVQDCSDPDSAATGAMVSGGEVVSHSGAYVPLPSATYGSGNPNTNEAMRLHGSAGWVPWNTSLTTQHTETWDERTSTPAYVKSDIHAHYLFSAYSP